MSRTPQSVVWELREPTTENPDVGLNWLVRSAKPLRRRDGQPNVAAIRRLTGISYSALNAILPARRNQRDFRVPDQGTLGRLALAGSLLNRVSTEYAHGKLFRLLVETEAIAGLEQRIAELEASEQLEAA